MPHFIVEYSSNLESSTDFSGLADLIRDTAVETGVFPLGGIRVRMHPCTVYTIADGDPEAAFVHIMLRMGAGRDLATRKAAAEQIFSSLQDFFRDLFSIRPLALSFEVCEIDEVLTFKQNSIHTFLKKNQQQGSA